jgi:hypothetical protein
MAAMSLTSLQEAACLWKLQHVNVVGLSGVFVSEGQGIMLMVRSHPCKPCPAILGLRCAVVASQPTMRTLRCAADLACHQPGPACVVIQKGAVPQPPTPTPNMHLGVHRTHVGRLRGPLELCYAVLCTWGCPLELCHVCGCLEIRNLNNQKISKNALSNIY